MENKTVEDAKTILLDIIKLYKYKEKKIKQVGDFFKKINLLNYYDLFADEVFLVNNDMVNSVIKEAPFRIYDNASVVDLNKLVNDDLFLRDLTNSIFRNIFQLLSKFEKDVYALTSNAEVDNRVNELINEIMVVLDSTKDNVAAKTLPLYSKLRNKDFLEKLKLENNFKIIIGEVANNKKDIPCECDDFRILLYYIYSLKTFFYSQKKEVVEIDLYKEILKNICSELTGLLDLNKELQTYLKGLYVEINNIKTFEQLEKVYMGLKDIYLDINSIIGKDDNSRLLDLFSELGFNSVETNKRSLK